MSSCRNDILEDRERRIAACIACSEKDWISNSEIHDIADRRSLRAAFLLGRTHYTDYREWLQDDQYKVCAIVPEIATDFTHGKSFFDSARNFNAELGRWARHQISTQVINGGWPVETEKEIKRKRIIQEIFPPFVLMENVPGIKSSYGGKILNEFLTDLDNRNAPLNQQYEVVYGVVNAANYGVPQTRKRFVLHAVRRDIFQIMCKLGLNLTLPIETHSQDGTNGKKKWVTVRETFQGLPALKAGERYSDDKIKNHACANLSEKNLRRMKIIRANGGSRLALPPELVLNCHKTYSGHNDVYGIMDPDKPAPTMTGGCLSYSKGRFGHPFEDRAISVREAARIQTFPDDYVFGENLTKAALEIGNAVPIKLVEASGKVFYDIMMSLINANVDAEKK